MYPTTGGGVAPVGASSAPLSEEHRQILAILTMKIAQLGLTAAPSQEVTVGPLITIYRVTPEGSTRVAQIESIAPDLSIVLGREVLVKRMPGESAVSIAVANRERTVLSWLNTAGDVYRFANANPDSVPLGFGVDYLGKPFVEDLTKLPHLLIAGSTGGGKSVLLNGILASLVYALPSTRLRVALSDTKSVEFLHFVGAPHLLFPPATSPFATLEQIDWLIHETENRMKAFASCGTKNITEFNLRRPSLPLPRIVFIIDEVGVVLDETKKIGRDRLLRLASQARASGIHIIIGIQRPDAKIIDGAIKTNFPARLSFKMPSAVDSRVILDTGGAEQLLAQGDMLYLSSIKPGLHRLHAPLTKTEDVQIAVEQAIHRE